MTVPLPDVPTLLVALAFSVPFLVWFGVWVRRRYREHCTIAQCWKRIQNKVIH